jgi:hypothetical protein
MRAGLQELSERRIEAGKVDVSDAVAFRRPYQPSHPAGWPKMNFALDDPLSWDSPDAPRTRTNLGTLAARLQAGREARVVTGTPQEQPQQLSRRRLEIRKLFDWFRAIQARV